MALRAKFMTAGTSRTWLDVDHGFAVRQTEFRRKNGELSADGQFRFCGDFARRVVCQEDRTAQICPAGCCRKNIRDGRCGLGTST